MFENESDLSTLFNKSGMRPESDGPLMPTGSISGKLDPRHLQALEPSLQNWLKSWWLPASCGILALAGGLALLAEVHLLQLLLVLGVLGCVGLITAMAVYLQHLRQKARIQALLEQMQQQESVMDELRQAQESLQQQDREKAQVLSVLAHDLRSPFSNLKNMLWLLEEDQLSLPEIQDLVPRLRRHIDGLYSSLDNLLIWSHNQTSGRAGDIMPVPVTAIAREMTEVYRPAAQQKQLELIAPPSNGLLALADADALRLILRNLLDNAIKFTPLGGSVTIEVQPAGDSVLLRVADTGIGMSTGQLNQLFAPAGKNVRRGTAGEKGFGLGLPLCRSYAEQAGGHFKVTSQPGQGTCFELQLPAVKTNFPISV